MARESIDVELTLDEREIILRHGYPFERLEKALKAIPTGTPTGTPIATIPIDTYQLDMLIGELSRSFNHGEAQADEEALLELCDRLEHATKYGDGTLDILM